MADWPLLFDTNRYETAGAVLASSGGTLITGDAVANTKGSYTELISASTFNASWIHVMVGGFAVEALVDIAVGGAGTEYIVAANLLVSEPGRVQVINYLLPVPIPSGTRLSGRCQTNPGGGSGRVLCQLGGQGFMASSPYSRVITYGADTTDTGGTQVDPGGSADTKGAYSQITASTTGPAAAVIIALGGQGNGVRTAARFLVDIAVGGAGTEQIIIPDLLVRSDTTSDLMAPPTTLLPCSVPAGVRLAARGACSITDATDRLFDIIVYGIG